MAPPTRKPKPERKPMIIRFEVKGESYEVRPDEVNGLVDREVRRASDESFTTHLAAVFGGGIGLDTLATLVYVARRQAGEQSVSWDQIAQDMSLNAIFDLHIKIEDDQGEAPAAS